MEEQKTGKVIAVVSAKGGVGQTMIATNLAIALQKKFLSIVLVDGKMQFGDIAVALDLRSAITMKEVAEEMARIDSSTISNYLNEHESGISVLPAPERPEFAELITKEIFMKTIKLLRQHNDFVVVDCGYAFEDTTIDLLDIADEILVITTLDIISLKNTKQLVDTFNMLGYTDKLRLILNRHNMESLIKAEDVPLMMGTEDIFYIANNFKVVSQSLNIGIPIVSRRGTSDVAKDLFKLAETIISKSPEQQQQTSKKKWFPLLK